MGVEEDHRQEFERGVFGLEVCVEFLALFGRVVDLLDLGAGHVGLQAGLEPIDVAVFASRVREERGHDLGRHRDVRATRGLGPIAELGAHGFQEVGGLAAALVGLAVQEDRRRALGLSFFRGGERGLEELLAFISVNAALELDSVDAGRLRAGLPIGANLARLFVLAGDHLHEGPRRKLRGAELGDVPFDLALSVHRREGVALLVADVAHLEVDVSTELLECRRDRVHDLHAVRALRHDEELEKRGLLNDLLDRRALLTSNERCRGYERDEEILHESP